MRVIVSALQGTEASARISGETRRTRPSVASLSVSVMSVGQQQYTILAPASTSSGYASPPRDTLPPSLSKKKTRKQASSKSSHLQRSPQPPGMTAAVAQTAVDRLISAQLKEQGFDGAEPTALQTLGDEVIACTSTTSMRRDMQC